jgi:lipopolysaccharide transport system permease protein
MSSQAALALTIIEPRRTWQLVDWGQLWRYRDLLYYLARRDLSVRYKHSVVGVAWVVLQPALTMVVFTILFGRLAGFNKLTGEGVPYAAYALCALVPWQLFAHSLNASSKTIVGNRHLITKVYFPRMLVPLASVTCGFVDFLVSCAALVVVLAWYGIIPGPMVFVLPLFVALELTAVIGVALGLSALTAIYRDFEYTLPFLTQLWFFVTPVVYPTALIPERWQWLVGLNPMAGVIEGIRGCLLGTPISWSVVACSAVVAGLILAAGAATFARLEKRLIDLV